MPVRTYQFLHIASKVQAGEGFLLLGVILRPPLGLLLLLTSSLVLMGEGGVGGEKSSRRPQLQKDDTVL